MLELAERGGGWPGTAWRSQHGRNCGGSIAGKKTTRSAYRADSDIPAAPARTQLANTDLNDTVYAYGAGRANQRYR
jgi:hypothetical protein